MKHCRVLLQLVLFALCVFLISSGEIMAQNIQVSNAAGQGLQDGRQNTSTALKKRSLLQKPGQITLRSVDDRRHIEVKFLDELNMGIGAKAFPVDRTAKTLRSVQANSLFENILQAGGQWSRMAGIPEEDVNRLRMTAQSNLNRQMANLNNCFILKVPPNVKTEDWIDQLNALPEIEIALPLPLPAPLPQPGNYQSRQGYLNAATKGINASYAWSLGDSGQNVTICDLEYSWNLSHGDLPPGIIKWVPPGYTDSDPYLDDNHGTAVLGELASLNDGSGTTGACYGATITVAPTHLNSAWSVGTAMMYAISNLSHGDVILVEQQLQGPLYRGPGNDTGLVPIEWWPEWYEVVLMAVGNGIHVVEAAGNGYQNLDSSVYSTGNYGHWPFLSQNNSGAIIVGAGAVPQGVFPGGFYGSDVARSRLSFSNYGSRLDLQGWGEMVVTTGYGGFYNGSGQNLWYDSSFAGTSSASPIVAASAVLVESRYEALYSRELQPLAMRTILKNTGSAQQSGIHPSSENIGPLPNVQGALGSNFSSLAFAGGTYPVGNSFTFKKLTQVADTLNKKYLTGNVIFELQADYNGAVGETFPIVFHEILTQGGNWTVTIRPASGVITRITSGSTSGYFPLINLNGIDRLTLDGRAGGTGSTIGWIIQNTSSSDIGPTIQLNNDATYNEIKYLQVEGSNFSGYTGTIYFGSYTLSQGNSQNIISHCDIRDRSDGIGGPSLIGVYSDWTAGAQNDSNTISDCNISNWINYGMKLYGMRWNLSSNSLYQQYAIFSTMTAIYLLPGHSQRCGGHTITGNFIGGSAPAATGSPLSNAGNSIFTGIQMTCDTALMNTISGNTIRNIQIANMGLSGFTGINFAGTAPSIQGIISGNTIGDTSAALKISVAGFAPVIGMTLNSVLATVDRNLVVNLEQTQMVPGDFRGFELTATAPNVPKYTVNKNKIYSVGPTQLGAISNVYGIYIDIVYDSVLMNNNMISLGEGSTNGCRYIGIYDNGALLPYGLNVQAFYNSIHIGGMSVGPDSTYCFLHNGVSKIAILDNIFNNVRIGGLGYHFALATAIAPFNPNMSDYNILNNLNSLHLTQFLGAHMNLNTWRVASLCDMNSFNANPQYVSPSTCDLHIDPSVYSPADNGGIAVLGINDDYDGNLRALNPDIGADEYTINAPGAFVLLSPGNGSSYRPTSDSLRWHSSSAAGKYDVYLDTNSSPGTLVSGNLADTIFTYTGIDTNKTYYWKVIAKNSSSNVTATGAPWSFVTGQSSGIVTRAYSMMNGWNMASVPLTVADLRKESVFPTATSSAFEYSAGYLKKDTLWNGTGYWVKFDSAQDVSISGVPYGEDSLDVVNKWNMIGSISNPVTVDSIVEVPSGIVVTPYYKYSGGYSQTDSIKPGSAYWVKTNRSGQLVLKSPGAVGAPKRLPNDQQLLQTFNSMLITDARGGESRLYFGNMEAVGTMSERWELPPRPPLDMFDVRFSSNRFVEGYPVKEKQARLEIELQSPTPPLTLNWDLTDNNFVYWLVTGINERQLLTESIGSTTIQASVTRLVIEMQSAAIPKAFALEQNYPNPFNASTIIRFAAPLEAKIVIKLYNVLGQEIMTLLDEVAGAGYKSFTLNASGLASGLYFYRIEATSVDDPSKIFTKVMKMALIK
jgi:serine protease